MNRQEYEEKIGKFRHWFTNVYWYHYKWHTIAAAIAIFFVILFIHDIVTRVDPDFQMIIVSKEYVSNDQLAEITEIAQNAAGDVNGDSREYVCLNPISLAEGQMQYANTMKLAALLSDGSIVVYVMDADTVEIYKNQDLFEPLESLGLTGTDGDKYLVEVDGLPVFKRCFEAYGAAGTKYYAGFRYIPDDKRGDPETQARYQAAEKVMKALEDAK